MKYQFILFRLFVLLLVGGNCLAAESEARWWKGNLHTHSLWSDGDDYPEMIADWYKQNGYNFLMLSDHNLLSEGVKWSNLSTNKGGTNALAKYVARFGNKWVEQRVDNGKRQVRLKTLAEIRGTFEETGRFLMIRGEELTDKWKTAPVHMNVTNIREVIKPKGGSNVLEVLQNNVNAVLEQRQRTGQLMFPHLNHPNFGWGVTAEELMRVQGERFFEVYNGHLTARNEGDTNHASMDKVWDIILTWRLAELGLPPMFGLGTDDAHNYHTNAMSKNNSGRGWVMVRSSRLAPEDLIRAMEAGDFYASNGVRLKDVRNEKTRVALEIEAEAGVTYTTQFIGTRKGFDKRNEPVRAPNGEALRLTHRYSADVGTVLAEVAGTSASYELKGDEIYVRAKIISSKLKNNPPVKGELEMAWTQPLVTGVK